MRSTFTIFGILLLLSFMLVQCTSTNQQKPEILVTLPDNCNTPDGCTLAPNNDIILSIPNLNNPALLAQGMIEKEAAPVMLKINTKNEVEEFYVFKAEDYHPQTGKLGPMGCDFGPDGNLYVADSQLNFNPNNVSRILRINIENGKAVSCDVVIEGFVVPNAVIWKENTLFVSETMLVPPTKDGGMGAIYKFNIDEWSDKPVHIKTYTDAIQDSHLIEKFETSGRIGFSADGLTFDGQGNLYCSIFEDGTIFKTTFNSNGLVKETTLFAQDEKMASADGIFWNKTDNKIYAADMLKNAVQAIDMNGNVSTVYENGDTDGSEGSFDQPCEVIVRGNELIVVNMDMYFESEWLKNTKIDKPFTLSKFDLN